MKKIFDEKGNEVSLVDAVAAFIEQEAKNLSIDTDKILLTMYANKIDLLEDTHGGDYGYTTEEKASYKTSKYPANLRPVDWIGETGDWIGIAEAYLKENPVRMTRSLKTTFQEIKENRPCPSGWKKLIKKYEPRDLSEEVTYKQIYESNGFDDAAWAVEMTCSNELKEAFFKEALPVFERLSGARNYFPIIEESGYPLFELCTFAHNFASLRGRLSGIEIIFEKHFINA